MDVGSALEFAWVRACRHFSRLAPTSSETCALQCSKYCTVWSYSIIFDHLDSFVTSIQRLQMKEILNSAQLEWTGHSRVSCIVPHCPSSCLIVPRASLCRGYPMASRTSAAQCTEKRTNIDVMTVDATIIAIHPGTESEKVEAAWRILATIARIPMVFGSVALKMVAVSSMQAAIAHTMHRNVAVSAFGWKFRRSLKMAAL